MVDHVAINQLFRIVEKIAPLDEALQVALAEHFEEKTISKGHLLLREGEVCRHLWFLSDGLLRSFHDINGKEVTSRLMFTGHIVISAGSFFTQTPATESIEALSDCGLLRIGFDQLQRIYQAFPSFNFHTRIITEQYFARQEQRLYLLRKHDALPKYQYFLEHYADWLKEIPQKYIASFLNITPETLSRVRAKLAEQK